MICFRAKNEENLRAQFRLIKLIVHEYEKAACKESTLGFRVFELNEGYVFQVLEMGEKINKLLCALPSIFSKLDPAKDFLLLKLISIMLETNNYSLAPFSDVEMDKVP